MHVQTVAQIKLVTLESAYLNYAKNSSCRILCINAWLIHHSIFSTVSTMSSNLVRNYKIGFAIGFIEISILRLFKTAWFPASTQNTLYAILCWVNEQNEQVHSENYYLLLENWFPFIFIYDLCYEFWFSRSVSNMLSTTFNWAKWVKWIIPCQELNISLWNLFLWIQCPRIWVRDRNSFITECSFWRSFCWVHWVKRAITWSKPHNCAWEPILLDSAPLN